VYCLLLTEAACRVEAEYKAKEMACRAAAKAKRCNMEKA